MCISGDVPASLLSLGKPEEVHAYCKRLIDEVGDGWGFMLTTGCECPIDVKPENLRAMVDTGRTYQGKKVARKLQPAAEQALKPAVAYDLEGELAQAVAGLRFDDVMNLVDNAMTNDVDPLKILTDCRAGMDQVGERYKSGEYFLSELIMSADMFKKVAQKVEPLLMEGKQETSLGSVVIATPKGDIHDIGKNIVATLFKAGGFRVYDLGVDVAPDVIVDQVAETDAEIVALSALITPTFESMKQVVDRLKEQNLRQGRFIILGGGPTTTTVRDYVGADAWTLNPKEGVDWCKEFVQKL
jgi:methylmalonyl-CoA mutase cobalamin-binding domain/chain